MPAIRSQPALPAALQGQHKHKIQQRKSIRLFDDRRSNQLRHFSAVADFGAMLPESDVLGGPHCGSFHAIRLHACVLHWIWEYSGGRAGLGDHLRHYLPWSAGGSSTLRLLQPQIYILGWMFSVGGWG